MGKNVLIIDDEVPVRDSFILALEDTDISVETASSGEEGLEKFKNAHYDLVYLDLNMPGISGIETLREIRKLNNRVLVYIVTAFSKIFFKELEKLREDSIEFELMLKPIGLDQIKSITVDLLR